MLKEMLTVQNIRLNQTFETKEALITAAGQLLVAAGHVTPDYIDTMLEREALSSTYMGNMIAIPHGTDDAKAHVMTSGLCVIQLPEGIYFGENLVKIAIGIAGKGDEHLDILSNIAIFCSEEANVNQLTVATTAEEILALLTGDH